MSEQFGNLLTGQKTSFGKTFESLGQQMVQASVKSALQRGLGKLGGLFGIHSPSADNWASNPHHVIVDNFGGNALNSLGPQRPPLGLPGGAAIGAAAGGAASGIGGFFKSLFAGGGGTPDVSSTFTPLATGGDVYPGNGYIVGDGGEPEFFSPKTPGTITPMSHMGGMTVNNHIDARGAALGVEGRIGMAISQAHKSAVAMSVQSVAERAKRTPRGR